MGCEAFSQCKGRGFLAWFQTFFGFLGWVVATGDERGDRGEEGGAGIVAWEGIFGIFY